MKRFYCTICQRVKRVRHHSSTTDTHPSNPSLRIGQCERHSAGTVHPSRVGPAPRVSHVVKQSSAPAVNKQAQRQNHKQSSKGVK